MEQKNVCGAVNTLKTHKYVNVVPSKEDVDYDATYYFTDPELVKNTFKILKGNRKKIDKKHVAEIRDAFLDPLYGRFVDSGRVDINTYFCTDTQHRMFGWLDAYEINPNIPPFRVRFEDYPKDKLIDIIIKINCGTKPWGIADFSFYLETIGDSSMIRAKDFGESHRLLAKTNKKGEVTGYYPRYVYAVLLGRNATKEVKNGVFEISKKDLRFGEKVYLELEKLFDAAGFDMNCWFESFAQSWYNLRKDDMAYCELVDKVGIDKVCEAIKNCWNDLHPVTKRSEWDKRFRYAIYYAKKNL